MHQIVFITLGLGLTTSNFRVGNHVVFAMKHGMDNCFLLISKLPFLSLLVVVFMDLCITL